MPKTSELVEEKPIGDGWVNSLTSDNDWEFEENFWQLENNVLHGKIGNEKEHHNRYTKKIIYRFRVKFFN